MMFLLVYPPPYFEAEYCLFCGRRSVAVARYRMICLVLEIKDTTDSNTSASYLDLLLSIGRDGQLHTTIYDKRDDFNFYITNFPFLSSNIPASPAYGVFISQLIRYARLFSSYGCFILRAVRLSHKLPEQGYVKERFRTMFFEYPSVLSRLFLYKLFNNRYFDVMCTRILALFHVYRRIMRTSLCNGYPLCTQNYTKVLKPF